MSCLLGVYGAHPLVFPTLREGNSQTWPFIRFLTGKQVSHHIQDGRTSNKGASGATMMKGMGSQQTL